MSYELYIVDLDEMPGLDELFEAIEETADDGASRTPTEKLQSFLRDALTTFPSLEVDPANSPWLMSNSDRLFDVFMEFDELAWRYDLMICDPQEGTIRRPSQE